MRFKYSRVVFKLCGELSVLFSKLHNLHSRCCYCQWKQQAGVCFGCGMCACSLEEMFIQNTGPQRKLFWAFQFISDGLDESSRGWCGVPNPKSPCSIQTCDTISVACARDGALSISVTEHWTNGNFRKVRRSLSFIHSFTVWLYSLSSIILKTLTNSHWLNLSYSFSCN